MELLPRSRDAIFRVSRFFKRKNGILIFYQCHCSRNYFTVKQNGPGHRSALQPALPSQHKPNHETIRPNVLPPGFSLPVSSIMAMSIRPESTASLTACMALGTFCGNKSTSFPARTAFHFNLSRLIIISHTTHVQGHL